MATSQRSPRNRTIALSADECQKMAQRLKYLDAPSEKESIIGKTICQDVFEALPYLPSHFVDLLIVDPPYNLNKSFNGNAFKSVTSEEYSGWIESWIVPLRRTLKPNASLYVCSDWRSSASIYPVLDRYFFVQNRITWEREKGRGALRNWKNCLEDIWFCTVSKEYVFNVEDVKLKRRVIAPYRNQDGEAKDWEESENGGFRLTYPSNLWTDISIPFWSMPENTEHPTQKPEKLMAKLILASSNRGDVVFDPFVGSGTTSVVAKKLGREFVGIEMDPTYASLTEMRLAMADSDMRIQGYNDGVFWERNTLALQNQLMHNSKSMKSSEGGTLFSEEGLHEESSL